MQIALSGSGARLEATGIVLHPHGTRGYVKFRSRPSVANEDALVRQWLPAVHKYARRNTRRGLDFEEATSRLLMELLHAIRTYDPRRGPQSNFILLALSQPLYVRQRHESLDPHDATQIPEPNREEVTELDPNTRRALRAAIRALPEAQRNLLREIYCGGKTLKELGDRFGITGAAVHSRKKTALAALRRLMSPDPAPDAL